MGLEIGAIRVLRVLRDTEILGYKPGFAHFRYVCLILEVWFT
jgi:hypothetical protein